MEVKEDYLKLKERWIQSDGAERKRVEAELDDFFDSLEISDNMQLEETINEDFKRIHQKLDEAKENLELQYMEWMTVNDELEQVNAGKEPS